MIRNISITDIENVGEALSTLIQTRYNWLFNHISRAILLEYIDNPNYIPPRNYGFSQADIDNGKPLIEVEYIIYLLKKSVIIYAGSKDGTKYDYDYVREVTRTGLRMSYLISAQSFLEIYNILNICKNHSFPEKELFDFIRQARNIVCHGNGIMNSNRITRCQWKNKVIEKNGNELRISDYELLELIDEAIVFLVKLYIENGREIDGVSLNLGFTIPFIKGLNK